ncbi:hypothetical protein OH77DRAFT_1594518 [Trametes cingulata]|nr:hypothetical protein OH77DRAFT_1594518 [Trametes cingulata]
MAPMNFAIVTGWQAIMTSIFPAPIDSDLLKLVHLLNGFSSAFLKVQDPQAQGLREMRR